MQLTKHCPINIYRDGKEINVYDLIAIQFNENTKTEFIIRNDFGEHRKFVFFPNREIIKISQNVSLFKICEFVVKKL